MSFLYIKTNFDAKSLPNIFGIPTAHTAPSTEMLFWFHHGDKFFIIDLPISIDHFIYPLFSKLHPNPHHYISSLHCRNEPITILVELAEYLFDQSDLSVSLRGG